MDLTPGQQSVISWRGGDLQIVACAGAGKTEAVSRRVAALLGEGVEPGAIIAFTFTEKAGAELKERIYRRTEEIAGRDILDRLGPMFVGTIHGWCFHMLQEQVPHYGNHEVLDEHRHSALLSREVRALELKALGDGGHWAGIREWKRLVDVIGNELIDPESLGNDGLKKRYRKYADMLERFHFLTFSSVITGAVQELEKPRVRRRVCGPLRHLIVDEYQDINPAQERLIRLLSKPPVQLCVVGDDDQAIYQWRGSDVKNIVSFARRREDVKVVNLLENRRSRPLIVETAARFASAIPGRLPKKMQASRGASGPMLTTWSAPTDVDEGTTIAATVEKLLARGFRHQDIAILLRSVRTSAGPILAALAERGIPTSCGGRTGLFAHPEIDAIGRVYALLAGFEDWRVNPFAEPEAIDPKSIATLLARSFKAAPKASEIEILIKDWVSFNKKHNTRAVDLVKDYYVFLRKLNVPDRVNADTPEGSARLGALARFSQLLADYEHVTRRGRYAEADGKRKFESGADRGKGYWFNLGNYLLHYARDAYEDFEGEAAQSVDAVPVLTVHQAKGLEWPVVFMPSLVKGRFPVKQAGKVEESGCRFTRFFRK